MRWRFAPEAVLPSGDGLFLAPGVLGAETSELHRRAEGTFNELGVRNAAAVEAPGAAVAFDGSEVAGFASWLLSLPSDKPEEVWSFPRSVSAAVDAGWSTLGAAVGCGSDWVSHVGALCSSAETVAVTSFNAGLSVDARLHGEGASALMLQLSYAVAARAPGVGGPAARVAVWSLEADVSVDTGWVVAGDVAVPREAVAGDSVGTVVASEWSEDGDFDAGAGDEGGDAAFAGGEVAIFDEGDGAIFSGGGMAVFDAGEVAVFDEGDGAIFSAGGVAVFDEGDGAIFSDGDVAGFDDGEVEAFTDGDVAGFDGGVVRDAAAVSGSLGCSGAAGLSGFGGACEAAGLVVGELE